MDLRAFSEYWLLCTPQRILRACRQTVLENSDENSGRGRELLEGKEEWGRLLSPFLPGLALKGGQQLATWRQPCLWPGTTTLG